MMSELRKEFVCFCREETISCVEEINGEPSGPVSVSKLSRCLFNKLSESFSDRKDWDQRLAQSAASDVTCEY